MASVILNFNHMIPKPCQIIVPPICIYEPSSKLIYQTALSYRKKKQFSYILLNCMTLKINHMTPKSIQIIAPSTFMNKFKVDL